VSSSLSLSLCFVVPSPLNFVSQGKAGLPESSRGLGTLGINPDESSLHPDYRDRLLDLN
jgi:hypothetical protein